MSPLSMLLAEIQRGQLLMLAGFVMLGWVLARRTIRRRKKLFRDGRDADQAMKKIRHPTTVAVPLCDAPPETQRWQIALFDLQRELKAELDTRIAIVQTLIRQADERIENLEMMENRTGDAVAPDRTAEVADLRELIERLRGKGKTCEQIALDLQRPLGEIELISATIQTS